MPQLKDSLRISLLKYGDFQFLVEKKLKNALITYKTLIPLLEADKVKTPFLHLDLAVLKLKMSDISMKLANEGEDASSNKQNSKELLKSAAEDLNWLEKEMSSNVKLQNPSVAASVQRFKKIFAEKLAA